MKEIINKNNCALLRRFDNSDFSANRGDIIQSMNTIFASYEQNNENYDNDDALEYLSYVNEDFFEKDDTNACVYILYVRENPTMPLIPIGIAIFSDSNVEKAKHLEYISIHFEHSGCGYGEWLLGQCAIDLQKQGYSKITSVVNKKNFASEKMHYGFANSNNVKVVTNDLGGRCEYVFDIEHINEKPQEDQIIL